LTFFNKKYLNLNHLVMNIIYLFSHIIFYDDESKLIGINRQLKFQI
jgi:hypothetical protein